MERAALDDVIQRLLEVRRYRAGKQVQLAEWEIRQLCAASKDVLMRQPNLLELQAPIKIAGHPHPQELVSAIVFSTAARSLLRPPQARRRSTRDKLPVEEHSGQVSSREFEALTLGQSPTTLDSTHSLARTATRVRQSVLYSKRLMQSSHSRQEQKPSPNKSLVEENAGRLSSSKGPTVKDLSKSKELVLNDTPPKHEITNRSKQSAYDTASSKIAPEVVEEKPKEFR